MISFDTNVAVYAANSSMPQHAAARRFLGELSERDDVVVCELMLVELYLKLQNQKIFPTPLNASAAVSWCDTFRNNRKWMVVESGPAMSEVWRRVGAGDFAFRRIIDLRLALVLRHYGVGEFATTNVQDFQDFGFTRVWNPLLPPI